MGCLISHQDDAKVSDVPYTSYITPDASPRETKSPIYAYRRYVVVQKLDIPSPVYLYFDKEAKTQVCIKRQTKNAAKVHHCNDLSREIRMLSKLKRLGAPHFTECLDTFDTTEYKMMVLPWRKHGDLFEWGHKHEVSEDVRKDIMRQLIKGLAFMHDHDMAHGDISLENVLIRQDQPLTVEWCDLSMGLEEGVHMPCVERKGKSWGKKDYMSPDAYYKDRDVCLAKTDIWGLGVLFFIMATGFKNVIYGKAEGKFWKVLLTQGFQSTYRRYFEEFKFAPMLIDLIDHMLVENPEKRYTIHDVEKHPYLTE